MSVDYAPFPEMELHALEKWHFERVRQYGHNDDIQAIHTIRNALASYKALNERCLRAELERDHGVKP